MLVLHCWLGYAFFLRLLGGSPAANRGDEIFLYHAVLVGVHANESFLPLKVEQAHDLGVGEHRVKLHDVVLHLAGDETLDAGLAATPVNHKDVEPVFLGVGYKHEAGFRVAVHPVEDFRVEREVGIDKIKDLELVDGGDVSTLAGFGCLVVYFVHEYAVAVLVGDHEDVVVLGVGGHVDCANVAHVKGMEGVDFAAHAVHLVMHVWETLMRGLSLGMLSI